MFPRFSITFIILFSLFVFSSIEAKNLKDHARDFEKYQHAFGRTFIEGKIAKMLQKDPEVADWYQINENSLKIFASMDHKQKGLAEFTLYFGDQKVEHPNFVTLKDRSLPLKGLRVAIDPGHFGGQYARIEEKYIDLEHPEGHNCSFDEGTLTVQTALKLATKLESLGASVYLTKNCPGQTVYSMSFEAWQEAFFDEAVEKMVALQSDPTKQQLERNWWHEKASSTNIFRSTYNYIDLDRRAELINVFQPHVTIACHYNLGGIYDKHGKTPGIEEDFSLYFVPGAFKRGSQKDEAFRNSSLKGERSRYEFVRLLVTDDIEKSIALAKITRSSVQKAFNIPLGDHCTYLNTLCKKADDGIYHRNLALLRLVHGPILYAEPLCQDNLSKALQIATNPDIITEKVADVYLASILKWIQEEK